MKNILLKFAGCFLGSGTMLIFIAIQYCHRARIIVLAGKRLAIDVLDQLDDWPRHVKNPTSGEVGLQIG